MKLRLKSKMGIALIALSIIALVFLAIGKTEPRVPLRSREAVLKTDLRTMRDAIDHYTLDKQQAPQSLQDLVDARYLRAIPVDPMTHKADWVPVSGEVVMSPEQKTTGLFDVHSNSNGVDGKNRPYSEW